MHCWHTSNERPRGEALRHNTVCGNNAMIADGNPRSYDSVIANPNIVADRDWALGGQRLLNTRRSIKGDFAVRIIRDKNIASDQAVIANVNSIGSSNIR